MRGFFHHSNTSKKLHQLVTEFCRVASDVCHPFTSLKFVRSSVPLFTHSTSFRQQPCPKKTSLPSSVGMNVFSKNPFSLKLFKKRTFLSIPLWSAQLKSLTCVQLLSASLKRKKSMTISAMMTQLIVIRLPSALKFKWFQSREDTFTIEDHPQKKTWKCPVCLHVVRGRKNSRNRNVTCRLERKVAKKVERRTQVTSSDDDSACVQNGEVSDSETFQMQSCWNIDPLRSMDLNEDSSPAVRVLAFQWLGISCVAISPSIHLLLTEILILDNWRITSHF